MSSRTAAPVKPSAVTRHRDDEEWYPVSLYRLFDHRGRLLYIGVAEDVNARVYMHMATYTMADCGVIHRGYARHESVEHPSRKAAREAERKAIAAEKPWLNRQHNPGRWRRVAGQYQPVDPAAYAELVETVHADFVAALYRT